MGTLRARVSAFFGLAQRAAGPHATILCGDESGVVAVLFAIIFAAMFLMAAIAIDYGRTGAELVRVQNAVDSGALAASHRLGCQTRTRLARKKRQPSSRPTWPSTPM
ncbi:MAG: hypothetical protein HC869_06525 [Rhodospirillales bacterium]|nr:hypothetical protein [Rhodospirillales bacterium]